MIKGGEIVPNVYRYMFGVAYEGKPLICGSFVLERGDDFYTLWAFKIDEQYRRKGFGNQMMKDILKEIKGPIYLYVEYDNEPAVNFYKKHGFVESDEKITHITNPGPNINKEKLILLKLDR